MRLLFIVYVLVLMTSCKSNSAQSRAEEDFANAQQEQQRAELDQQLLIKY